MIKLQHALTKVASDLSIFAASRRYANIFADVFGNAYSKAAAHAIQAQLRSGDLRQLARVEVVSQAVLGSAHAAYATANSTIYLSDRFLEEASPSQLQAALLEEIGHAIDARVNASDRPGDEGELFSLLVRGITPTASERQQILAEDDRRTVTIQGMSLVVEQAAPVTYAATLIYGGNSYYSDYALSGRNAVWVERKGINHMLRWFDGNGISTITNSPYNEFGDFALSGDTVIYTKNDGQDDEVYRFSGGISTRLTNNTTSEGNLLVDGNTVAWESYTVSGGTSGFVWEASYEGYGYERYQYEVGEIYRYDGTSTTRITNNLVSEEDVQLSGSNILWAASDGNDYEIYLNDGSTTRNITNNSVDDYSPILQGNRAAWFQNTNNGPDNLFFFDGEVSWQITSSKTVLDPAFLGSALVYKEEDPSGDSLKVYSSATGGTRQLNGSNTFVYDVATSNNLVAWIEAPKGASVGTSTKTLKLFNGSATTIIDSGTTLNSSPWASTLRLSESKLLYLKNSADSYGRDLYLYDAASPGIASTRVSTNEKFWYIYQITSVGNQVFAFLENFDYDQLIYRIDPSQTSSLPVISISVFPTTGVEEDGPTNLTFTLTRSGPTSSSLSVGVSISGTTSPSDYTQPTGFSDSSGFVVFNPGSSTASVTINPTTDVETEPNESMTLTIAPSGSYAIGASSYATGLILNDDTYVSRDDQGNSRLLSRHDGSAFVEIAGNLKEVVSPWGVKVGNDSSDWQLLAAETVNGVNQLLWRHNIYNFLHTWVLDTNWSWVSSGGTDGLNSPAAWDLESSFQVDANRDGIIGRYATIENRGNTKLLRRADDNAVVDIAGTRKEVYSPWGGAKVGNDFSTWQILACETIAGFNQILWRNNTYNLLHPWTLDSNWNWVSSGGTFDPVSPEGFALQAAFGL